MKIIKKIIPILLCVCIVFICGCTPDNTGADKKTAYGYDISNAIDIGVVIDDIYLYSGKYIEDGSYDECENVAALKVKNLSETDIQLIRINVKTDTKELSFEITTLVAGSTVIVLEKSKQTIAENEKIISIETENRADFSDRISLKTDTFIVQGNLSTMNIKNISPNEIQGDIYIYYKKKDADGNYFGGITFRTKAAGLKPSEIKQLPAANFDPSDSEVLFVDYAE